MSMSSTSISTNLLWDLSRNKLDFSLDRNILAVFFWNLLAALFRHLDSLLLWHLLTVLLGHLRALLIRDLHLLLFAVLLWHILAILLWLLLGYLCAAFLGYLLAFGCTVAVVRGLRFFTLLNIGGRTLLFIGSFIGGCALLLIGG